MQDPKAAEATQGAKVGRIHPVMARALAPFAPAGSTVHRDAAAANDAPLSEAERADLAYHHLKVSGGLQRDDVKRAHAEEVRAGVHQ